MSEYFATVQWERQKDEAFVDSKYSREHRWLFDGGAVIQASPSPHIVPLPYSIASHVDPEEAFVASLSSCHMLFFLSIAAQRNFIIDEYIDQAIGVLGKNSAGKLSMTQVTLRPKIIFSGDILPTAKQIETIHHQSHEQCFIANSVKTKIVIEMIP